MPKKLKNNKTIVLNKLSNQFVIKNLIAGRKNSSGRNNKGQITNYNKGGGHKKLYRKVNFYNAKYSSSISIVTSIEYDPYRNSNIASTYNYKENKFNYILAPNKLKVGNIIKTGSFNGAKIGYSMPIRSIPMECLIYNVAPKPNAKSTMTRAAGTSAKIVRKTRTTAIIKLSSKELKEIPIFSYASIGTVSNELSNIINLNKAGKSRWLNRRPTVRGVAMNPVDHPHGGGEGKTSGGRPSVTPWGKPARGVKTRKTERINVTF